MVALFFWLYAGCLLTTLGGMELSLAIGGFFFLFGLVLPQFQMDKKMVGEIFLSWPMLIAYVFMIIVILSVVMSPIEPQSTKTIIDSFGSNRHLLLMAMVTCLWRQHFLFNNKYFLRWLFSIAIIVCLYSFAQHLTGIDLVRSNNKNIAKLGSVYLSAGLFSQTLTYAYSLGAFFFFMLPFVTAKDFRSKDIITKVLGTTMIVLIPFSLLTTGVRGAWVAFVICFIIALVKGLPKKYLAKVVLPGAAVIGLVFLTSSAFFARLQSIFSMSYSSNASRVKIWQAHLAVFQDYPILGAGFEINDKIVAQYYEKLGLLVHDNLAEVHHAHNDYIEFLAGTGVIGFIAYCGLLFVFMRLAYRCSFFNSREKRSS